MGAGIGFASLILGSSLASGINLYLTTAGLGVAHQMGWITLPGHMEVISHPVIIILAIGLYAVEFVADKVPYVDSTWDSVHTFIRPAGAILLVTLATSDWQPIAQTAMALLGGTLAFDSHLTKASTRVAINASPEPITNSVASVTEDVSVLGILWLIINHPVFAILVVILFFALSVWLMPKLFRLFGKVFGFLFKGKDAAGDIGSAGEAVEMNASKETTRGKK